MISKAKSFLKKILPSKFFSWYHWFFSLLGASLLGFPSEKMVVIGVTGTNGKSTVTNLVARVLLYAGKKVGLTSTVNFRIGDRDWLNTTKMTMLGRMKLQSFLRDMKRENCTYAVIETSSEGIKQYRHRGINYDVAVFTNLTPEHIESHGSFLNYRKAKQKLFLHTSRGKKKKLLEYSSLKGKKVGVVNLDDEWCMSFLSYDMEYWGYTVFPRNMEQCSSIIPPERILQAKNVHVTNRGISFQCDGHQFNLKLFGLFNVYNALGALAVGRSLGIDWEIMKQALETIEIVPGRMEFIHEGQPFHVLIDYAPEPASLTHLYQALSDFHHERLIHVLGSAGGGRDKGRRPILGRMAGKKADVVIVTNEDPYDEDPYAIMDQVAAGALEAGKELNINLFKVTDRREAIELACEKAGQNDLILITGKGSEQAMVVAAGKKIPWDDREVAREILRKRVFRKQ